MQAAKQSISNFLHRSGKQETQVDEVLNLPVTNETVKPQRHERTTQAIDREVHQHHYHTTVQPLSHSETLPEKHSHQVLPVRESVSHHDNPEEDQRKVGAVAAQFKDLSVTEAPRHTSAQMPAVTGEHTHHHVHETVQPIVYKETFQKEVVHTTRPIHERHLAPSEHHGLSMMPAKTMAEFTATGGTLEGGAKFHDQWEGDPRPYNPSMQMVRYDVDINPEAHDGYHDLEKTGHNSMPSPSAINAMANPNLESAGHANQAVPSR